jgi:hypothetical protein
LFAIGTKGTQVRRVDSLATTPELEAEFGIRTSDIKAFLRIWSEEGDGLSAKFTIDRLLFAVKNQVFRVADWPSVRADGATTSTIVAAKRSNVAVRRTYFWVDNKESLVGNSFTRRVFLVRDRNDTIRNDSSDLSTEQAGARWLHASTAEGTERKTIAEALHLSLAFLRACRNDAQN